MLDWINYAIDTYNLALLSALLLGILTSLSPCPLATNITAIAYITKDMHSPRQALLLGLIYTLGRGVSYTGIAMILYFGFSSFELSRMLGGWSEVILGPILILIGVVMTGVIRIPRILGTSTLSEKLKCWLATQGYLGALALGMFFALAFCPYSGVLFFGALMPLVLSSPWGLFLPPLYALGTGLPVILFSALLAYGMRYVGKTYDILQKIEKWLRFGVAGIFIIAGMYYLQYLF